MESKTIIAAIYGLLGVSERELELPILMEHLQMVISKMRAERLITDQVARMRKSSIAVSGNRTAISLENFSNILYIRDANTGRRISYVNAGNLPFMRGQGEQAASVYFDDERNEQVLETVFSHSGILDIWYEPLNPDVHLSLVQDATNITDIQNTFFYLIAARTAVSVLPFINYDVPADMAELKRRNTAQSLISSVNEFTDLWQQEINRSRAGRITKRPFMAG